MSGAVHAVGHLLSVNVGRIVEADWAGELKRTAIDKRPVTGRVLLADDHVEGDEIADLRFHGGEHQAVYAYAEEDASFWRTEIGAALQRPIVPGSFGENLTTRGLDLIGAVVGERWALGTTVLEVSTFRQPCRVFQGYWELPGLMKRFVAAGRAGAYLRIVTEGAVAAGDPIEVVSRPDHGVTVGEAFRLRNGERALAVHVAQAGALPPRFLAWARDQVREQASDQISEQAIEQASERGRAS